MAGEFYTLDEKLSDAKKYKPRKGIKFEINDPIKYYAYTLLAGFILGCIIAGYGFYGV